MMPIMDKPEANDYLNLVKKIATFRHRVLINANIHHISINEFINEGYIGLVNAIEKYDPEQNDMSFMTHASYYISNAISQFLRNEDVVEFRMRKKIKEMRKSIETLQQELGRDPTELEVSKAMKMTIEQYRRLQAKVILVKYLDDADTIQEVGIDGMLGLKVPSSEEPQKDKKKKDLGKATDRCLKNTLNQVEMLIILLKEFRDFTLQDIVDFMGQGFNITKVHKININAKRSLKDCLEGKGWKIIDINAIYE